MSAACRAPATVVFLAWQIIAVPPALSQTIEALPNVRLRQAANVTECLRLQDGTTIIAGNIASVDGVEINASLVRLDAQGAVITTWAPGMKGSAECLAEDGGFLYVAGYGNQMANTSRYGAVRRIRLADGVLDPDFSIPTLGETDSLFFGGGWLFLTGNWEDSNIQAHWLGTGTSPANPITPRYDAFINSVEWAGVWTDRLLVLANGTLWSLPLIAVKGDSGVSLSKNSSIGPATMDEDGWLWILTGKGMRKTRPDKTAADVLIPFPSLVWKNDWDAFDVRRIAVWKGTAWICNGPSYFSSEDILEKPALYRRDPDGTWQDPGSGLFLGRPGAVRNIQADARGLTIVGQFALPSGAAGLLQLNGDGTFGSSHRILREGGRILDVEFLPGGGAMAGGDFEEADGLPQRGLIRFRPDWTFDADWHADCDGPVEALEVSGGSVIAGGWFTGFLGAFPLNGHGARDPAFPDWNRGAVHDLALRDGALFAVSQRNAAPSNPVSKVMITKSAHTSLDSREFWAVEDYRITRELGLRVVGDRVFVPNGYILSVMDGSGGSGGAYLYDPMTLLEAGAGTLLFSQGCYWPDYQSGRISFSGADDHAVDPIWLAGERTYLGGLDFRPMAAAGNWVYGMVGYSGGLERRSIYGQGEKDASFNPNIFPSLVRIKGRELLVGLVRFQIPELEPAPVISGHTLPSQVRAGQVVALNATLSGGGSDVGAVSYATNGVAAFGAGQMMLLAPGSFVVRAYQNGEGHEPAIERDVTTTVTPGHALRFSTGTYLPVPAFGTADAWPSVVNVRGFTGKAASLSVVIEGLYHKSPHDLQLVLESPAGKRLLLYNFNGGKADAESFRLVFNDAGEGLTDEALPASGLFRPVGGPPSPAMPEPLTSGNWVTSLTALLEDSPNGDWKFYAYDNDPDEHGNAIIRSWSLLFDTPQLTYESWAAQYFPMLTDDAAGAADPDADGIPNLAEYAFGTPPAGPQPDTFPFAGGGSLPVPLLEGPPENPSRTIRFTRRRNAGVVCQAEFSRDLSHWIPAETETITPIDEDWEQVTAPAPPSIPATADAAFARVRATSGTGN